MTTRKQQSAAPSADDLQSQRAQSAATLLRSADTRQADVLHSLSLIQQARTSRLARSAAASLPQTDIVTTSVAATQIASARFAAAFQQITTASPQVAASGWALHGRVYDKALQPLANYSVYLTDSQKAYQSAYGVDYTDATGYFLINSAGAGSAPAADLYLQIADAKGSPVYASAVQFTPTLAAAAYQVVILPAADAPIGNPPAEVRAAVLPAAKDADIGRGS